MAMQKLSPSQAARLRRRPVGDDDEQVVQFPAPSKPEAEVVRYAVTEPVQAETSPKPAADSEEVIEAERIPSQSPTTGQTPAGADMAAASDDDVERDIRASALASIPSAADKVVDIDIEQALQGAAALKSPEKVRFLKSFLRNQHERWKNLTNEYLAIGEELLVAQDRLGRDYDRVIMSRLLPYPPAIETQLRRVAQAVRDGQLPAENLPGYSVAYRLCQLEPPALQRAREANLIRPDVTRKEIDEFRRQIAREAERAGDRAVNIIELARERNRLIRQQGRLNSELRIVETRLEEIAETFRRAHHSPPSG